MFQRKVTALYCWLSWWIKSWPVTSQFTLSMETSSAFQSRRKPIKMPGIEHVGLVRSSVWPTGHVKTRLCAAADTKNHDEIFISSTLGRTLSLQSHQTVNLMGMFAGGWPAAWLRRVSEQQICWCYLSLLFFLPSLLGESCQTEEWFPGAGDKNGLLQQFRGEGSFHRNQNITDPLPLFPL